MKRWLLLVALCGMVGVAAQAASFGVTASNFAR